ncbi:PAS domain-containing sensor histidine kinase [Sinimarinibacterium sp. NLF-5-8]|uniref:sensor histidine kinase n=1 Tax=Sinimarinibacterium sp. NLF-5-8 TaxID=2698684 RepID=UPI00137C392A|nr:HAMP domain-containing sensor histidine kinase [Sinimarinibacterium sp. NLF-5-8]QHS09964.1 HAMP domain-containing histidine kinase [Sinimarinibacterium sp. NLF-5-8]
MTAALFTPRSEDWRALASLVPYRLLLVALLLTLYGSGYAPEFLLRLPTPVFYLCCAAYSAAALVLLAINYYRHPGLPVQAHINLGVDTTVIGALVWSTGGIASGLGALLLPSLIGTSLVLAPRLASVHAAAATLTMFGAEALSQLAEQRWSISDFSQTGLLGMVFFVVTLVASYVGQRARRSEAAAERMGSENINLSDLSAHIIEVIHMGVIVVDAQDRLRINNLAALQLLGRSLPPNRPLHDAAPTLSAALQQWRLRKHAAPIHLRAPASGTELQIRITQLGQHPHALTLILLEDTAQLREQAQQITLAALGRLSASVAHEIRNPLSAITQAGQLLAESTQIDAQNQRLLDMIQRHAGRIERIVRDVLDLSRRDPSHQQVFALRPWLVRAIALYHESHPTQIRPIELTDIDANIRVRFDPEHLQQIVFNLLDNSFAHGRHAAHPVLVRIAATPAIDTRAVTLELHDNGPGIDVALGERIFEPFFTTHAHGTGLGLFLCRQLCEYNGAHLTHARSATGTTMQIRMSARPPADSSTAPGV